MKYTVLLLLCSTIYVLSAPADKPGSSPAPKQGSPFISSFDEIVVESTLMVKGRNSPSRQGRTKLVAVTTSKPSNDTTSSSTTTSS
ncbi:hypothetical protein O3M35_009611 [Rhynocoris fuscipes]|uniref:Uncharacterized protein n=1 Tax=Rhynocoris fuscipes TaxID=488301 RepID=A0AAW1DAJ4_9HEMI